MMGRYPKKSIGLRTRVAGLGGSDTHLDTRLLVKKKNLTTNKAKNGTTVGGYASEKDPSKTRKNSMLSGKDDSTKK